MSQKQSVSDAVSLLQPLRRQKPAATELHPRLCEQLEEARLSNDGILDVSDLLPVV